MRAILAIVGGAFMLLSSAAHSILGWKALGAELAKLRPPEDLVGALGVGWIFGGVAMAAFGAIVIVAALRLRRGDASGAFALRTIGACYVVFGLAAFVARGYEWFFLNFVVAGLLASAPVLGAHPRPKQPPTA